MCFNITTEANNLKRDETMDITNTMCRLSDLTQDQINSLVKTMTKSGLCDFSTGAPLIRVTKEGTWVGYDGPTIVTYTEMMQLLKPKWTIYNNTLNWSELSDKQKGKLLLAAHARVEIIGLGMLSIPKPVVFNCGIIAYQAVKPEPTMEELFHSDFYDLKVGSVAIQMVAKGWVKK